MSPMAWMRPKVKEVKKRWIYDENGVPFGRPNMKLFTKLARRDIIFLLISMPEDSVVITLLPLHTLEHSNFMDNEFFVGAKEFGPNLGRHDLIPLS